MRTEAQVQSSAKFSGEGMTPQNYLNVTLFKVDIEMYLKAHDNSLLLIYFYIPWLGLQSVSGAFLQIQSSHMVEHQRKRSLWPEEKVVPSRCLGARSTNTNAYIAFWILDSFWSWDKQQNFHLMHESGGSHKNFLCFLLCTKIPEESYTRTLSWKNSPLNCLSLML